ncbi:MAG: phage holin family protein [Dysgonamonadaceae bacterium]
MEERRPGDVTLKGLIDQIKTEVTDYVELRLQLMKLEATEKGSIISSFVVYILFIAFITLLITIFVLTTLAVTITMLTSSLIIGFASVTGLIILSLIVVVLKGPFIRKKLTNTIISLLRKLEKENDD